MATPINRDLRIGSIGAFKFKSNIGIVTELSEVHFDMNKAKNFYPIEDFVPLSIDEVILLKLGFKKEIRCPNGYWKELPHYQLDSLLINYEINYAWAKDFKVKLDYVHQLQNLYMVLNGHDFDTKNLFLP